MGPVDIWRSIIVVVNCIISYQQHKSWCPKICKLAIFDDVYVPYGCLIYPVAQPDASYATGHPVA